jgi:hypothetical protein
MLVARFDEKVCNDVALACWSRAARTDTISLEPDSDSVSHEFWSKWGKSIRPTINGPTKRFLYSKERDCWIN